MNLTKDNINLIKTLHANGSIDLLKKIAEEMIENLRVSRIPLATKDDTLKNLYESYGGEKHLRQLFNHLHELANPEG